MLFIKRLSFDKVQEELAYTTHVSRLEQKDIEHCFARLFSTEDGKKALAWLQVMTFQRVQGAGTTDDQLRYMEGQRSLMASILRLIDRGRSN